MNKPEKLTVPAFDSAQLDVLMEDAGLDVVLANSKHNVQYFTGYRSFFFDVIDAIGVSRYLPVYVYLKGRPADAAFIGARLDGFDKANEKIHAPEIVTFSSTSDDAMARAIDHLKKMKAPVRRIGVETDFLPMQAYAQLTAAFPDAEIVDAFLPLERLRARKTPAECRLLREASERVVASMIATFAQCAPGMSKDDVVAILRREEVARDLNFEYCLITAGTSTNRAPSGQVLAAGEIMSLDSGGNYHGYVGDLCRMGVLGTPDQELIDLLADIERVQQAARVPVRPGTRGGEVVAAGRAARDASPHRKYLDFTAHGLGLITHEAPRLMSDGPIPYVGVDADRPLEAGMMLSIETTMHHPTRGFIKLEDTVAVTADGPVGYGDGARGWNRGQG